MKFNQWTLGLAAVGAVSMASAVRADEAKLSQLNTAVANTVISGYVDVAGQYNAGNPGKTTAVNQPIGLNGAKVDGFSVNAVDVTIEKPLDESPWASGYRVDLNWGTDAIGGLAAGSPLRQGYVALRTPVGNGIDWKVGLFDGITGYESNTGYVNPNYTRSYAYQVNPASFAGALASYKICDMASVQAGIANRGGTFGAAATPSFSYINGGDTINVYNPLNNLNQNQIGLSSKDYVGGITLTAPDSLGFLKGSTLNLQTVQGFDNGAVNNYSASATLNTPITGLKVGVAYDAVESLTADGSAGSQYSSHINIYGAYLTYQATDKLSLALRGEYVDLSDAVFKSVDVTVPGTTYGKGPNLQEVTATVQYDLWANVVSRLEFRWDHLEQHAVYNANSTESSYLVALNLVYKF